MNPIVGHNAYGKANVRFTKLKRRSDRHEVMQITSHTELEGDFSRSYTHGDNTNVIATDSIRNTTYALAADNPINSIEEFGIFVVQHYLSHYSQVSTPPSRCSSSTGTARWSTASRTTRPLCTAATSGA